MNPLAAADRMVDRLPEPFLNWTADRIIGAVTVLNLLADRAAGWLVAWADRAVREFTATSGPDADQ